MSVRRKFRINYCLKMAKHNHNAPKFPMDFSDIFTIHSTMHILKRKFYNFENVVNNFFVFKLSLNYAWVIYS